MGEMKQKAVKQAVGQYECGKCLNSIVITAHNFSSIFFLTALSVDRMIAVTKPTTTTWMRTRRGIRVGAGNQSGFPG